jgi:hypothetical protein
MAVAETGKRLFSAVGDALPVGLRVEEIAKQCRHLRLFDQPAARRFGDVAGEAEGGQREPKAARFQEMRKRPDEFEHDIIDVEDQQRPVVGCKFGDLACRLGIVAHIECSWSSPPSGSARKALPTEAGGVPVSSAKRSKVGSWARMNCRTPARNPGSAAARRMADASMPVMARKRGRSSGSAATKPSAFTAMVSASSRIDAAFAIITFWFAEMSLFSAVIASVACGKPPPQSNVVFEVESEWLLQLRVSVSSIILP